MKSILLSIVVVSALVVAGIGGVFADFNDYEVSEDNYFKMASMDLTVSDSAGVEYNGANVPALVAVDAGWPDCSKDRSWDVHNAGENEQAEPWVYIHFKNLDCEWVDTKITDTTPCAFLSVDANGDIVRPLTRKTVDDGNDIGIDEPQDVAIFGGVAGEDKDGAPVTVPGIGDDAYCLLSSTLEVTIEYSDQYPAATFPTSWSAVPAGARHILDLDAYDVAGNNDDIVQLSELECNQIYLFQLKGCYSRWMNMSLKAVNFPESEFEDAVGAPLDYFDESITAEAKWENWPTNATQNQKLWFDMGFEMFGQASKPF